LQGGPTGVHFEKAFKATGRLGGGHEVVQKRREIGFEWSESGRLEWGESLQSGWEIE